MLRKKISIVGALICLIFTLSTFIDPTPYMIAGEGKISSGKVNLIVMFNYDETDPDSWKPVFEEFSKLLYNATEKQLQLGTVNVANCSHIKEKADVWILNDNSGARAHVLGLGKTNLHITISQTHKSTSGSAIGQFGLTHEFGHYGFGLYDEYKGKIDGTGDWVTDGDLFFCVSKDDPVCCIMDGGTTVPIANGRYEFCTDPDDGFNTSHQGAYTDALGRTIETAQEINNHESCWETIVKNVAGLTAPTSEPQDDISGHQAITWNVIESIDRLVTCIDRSGSMMGEKINLAKQGAVIFVDLVHIGEHLAVTSFSSSATVNYSMTELASETDKTNAKTAINAISAGGSTNIGGGLRISLNQITGLGANAPGCAEVIVLLSDGMHNTGEHPNSVLPALIARGVKVYSIGLGTDADAALLSQIARSTGGTYNFAATASDLPNIFARISAETRADDAYTTFEETIASGENNEHLTPIDIFTNEITFELNWPSGNNLNLTLIDPSGNVVDPSVAAADPDIEFIDGGIHKFYRIQNPESGNWKSKVQAASVSGSIKYNLLVFGQSNPVSTYANTDQSSYVYPEKMLIQASVVANVPVAGVNISGIVTRPDGSTTNITLYDDGLSVHGDEIANDGIYSAKFSNYAGNNGSFNFKLVINNQNGFEVPADLLPASEEGGNYPPNPVPPFIREAQFSTVISGVPKILPMRSFDIGYAKIIFTTNHKDRFRGYGTFVVHENSTGFNPELEDVTVKVGTYEQTIPAGSFKKVRKFEGFITSDKDTTIWAFYSTADGITDMMIASVNGIEGVVAFNANNVDLSNTYNTINPRAVPFGLTIGDDVGKKDVQMQVVGPKVWIYGTPPVQLSKSKDIDKLFEESKIPKEFKLFQNYPNPFNSETIIRFDLPTEELVVLTIVDINGKTIAKLIDGKLSHGEHQIIFNANDLPSGIYFYQLKAGKFEQTGKMLLQK